MTAHLRFRPRARGELLEARDWYEGRSPGLGLEFARAVDAVLAVVVRMPAAFPPLGTDVRRALLRRFPYSILFAHQNDEVIVLTVHHHREGTDALASGAWSLTREAGDAGGRVGPRLRQRGVDRSRPAPSDGRWMEAPAEAAPCPRAGRSAIPDRAIRSDRPPGPGHRPARMSSDPSSPASPSYPPDICLLL